jgi:hypothetical protein
LTNKITALQGEDLNPLDEENLSELNDSIHKKSLRAAASNNPPEI